MLVLVITVLNEESLQLVSYVKYGFEEKVEMWFSWLILMEQQYIHSFY